MKKRYLVTGGTGFLGTALVHRLIGLGIEVRVIDNNSRGAVRRLGKVAKAVELLIGDIRDASFVRRAVKDIHCVVHLAFVNGTDLFYTQPEVVLEVGIRGMLNVLDACQAEGVKELALASSSEVYQTPPLIPTDESAPLSIPDVTNPRYSYAGGKIISELLAINYGRKGFDRVVIFRPHNVYGPDMGSEHVIPQFALRAVQAIARTPEGPLVLPIQGDGKQTRAFIHVDDFIDGLQLVLDRGEHLNIYHIGNPEEVEIAFLADLTGKSLGREVRVVPGPPAAGGTLRRCPDIRKLLGLGFRPRVPLAVGLPPTVRWYADHAAGYQLADRHASHFSEGQR